MKKLLLVGLCALLAACAGQETLFSGWGSPTPEPKVPEPLVGFVFDNGEAVDGVGEIVFRLNMARPELVYPFVTMADDEGFYNGLPVHRAVPGLVAEVGDGYWNGRETRAFPVSNAEKSDVIWGANLLAVRINKDGSVGPGLIFTTGQTSVERHLIPEGLVIGKAVDGTKRLWKLRKGDRLVRVWVRNLPHPSILQEKK